MFKAIVKEKDLRNDIVAHLGAGSIIVPENNPKSVKGLYDKNGLSKDGVLEFIKDNKDIDFNDMLKQLGANIKFGDVEPVANIIIEEINNKEVVKDANPEEKANRSDKAEKKAKAETSKPEVLAEVTDLLPVETSEEVKREVEAVNKAFEDAKQQKGESITQSVVAAANMQQPVIMPNHDQQVPLFSPLQFVQPPVVEQPMNTIAPHQLYHIAQPEQPKPADVVPVSNIVNVNGAVQHTGQKPADVVKPLQAIVNKHNNMAPVNNKYAYPTKEACLAGMPKDPRPDLDMKGKLAYLKKRIKFIEGTHPKLTEKNLMALIQAIDESAMSRKITNKFNSQKDYSIVEVPVPTSIKDTYDFCFEIKNRKNHTVLKFVLNSNYDAVLIPGEGYINSFALSEVKLN